MTRLRRLLGFGGAPGVQLAPDLMQLEHGCCIFGQCTGPIDSPQEPGDHKPFYRILPCAGHKGHKRIPLTVWMRCSVVAPGLALL